MTFTYHDLPVRANAAFDTVCATCGRQLVDLLWPDILIRREDGIFDVLCQDCSGIFARHALTGVLLAEYVEGT